MPYPVLTNLIGSLTSALSRYFLFGAYVPVLIFSALNAALLYVNSAWVRDKAASYVASPGMILSSATLAAFFATVVAAYMVMALWDFWRQLLEGKKFLSPGWADALSKMHAARRAEWETKLREAQELLALIVDGRPEIRMKFRAAVAAAGAQGQSDDGALEQALTVLRRASLDASTSTFNGPIQKAVAAITAASSTLAKNRLRIKVSEFNGVLDSIERNAMAVEYDIATKLQTLPEDVQPTLLGNIARSVDAYAIDRYEMDVTVFLSRLAAVLTKAGDKSYELVQETKSRLDFLISCWWLMGLTTVTWTIALMLLGGSWPFFAVLAVAGPVAMLVIYHLAAQSYQTYAETLRACIDLSRFQLLQALNIPRPASLRDERRIWSFLSRQALIAQRGADLSYAASERSDGPAT